MKKITIISGIIIYSLMSCKTSEISETHNTGTANPANPANIKRLAIPTVNRDTLYIEESLIPIFTEIWEDPKEYTRPVIMPLSLLEKDIIGKVEKIQIN